MNTILGSPLVMLICILGIVVYPVAKIVQRTGHSPWWTILMFIPLVNLIGLWVLALSKWPAIDRRT
jgi:hypothetical protein